MHTWSYRRFEWGLSRTLFARSSGSRADSRNRSRRWESALISVIEEKCAYLWVLESALQRQWAGVNFWQRTGLEMPRKPTATLGSSLPLANLFLIQQPFDGLCRFLLGINLGQGEILLSPGRLIHPLNQRRHLGSLTGQP